MRGDPEAPSFCCSHDWSCSMRGRPVFILQDFPNPYESADDGFCLPAGQSGPPVFPGLRLRLAGSVAVPQQSFQKEAQRT